MSARQQRTIDELVAVNEALVQKLAVLVEANEGLAERIEVTEQERDQFRGWLYQEKARDKSVEEDRKRYERERDEAKEEAQRIRWSLLGVERDRDAARAHAEAMRRQAFPDAPSFPWEAGGPGEVRMHGPNLKEMLESDGYALIEFLREQARNGVFGAQGGNFR